MGQNDTSAVSVKSFSGNTLQELREDPDLKYRQPETVAETLWERILKWLLQMIQDIFQTAATTSGGKLIVILLAMALVIVLVMMILKVDAFKVLFVAKGAQLKSAAIEENIHEMDFDALISQAVSQKDYRRGIRLLFLASLKLLADRHLIEWQTGKTNREYVSELSSGELRRGLSELSLYFDYAWYGNFTISADTYEKASHVFSNWKKKLDS